MKVLAIEALSKDLVRHAKSPNQKCTAERPDEKQGEEITGVWAIQGWLYLACAGYFLVEGKLTLRRDKCVSAKKTDILIIESDPQVLRFLTRCLHSEGYLVNSVNDEQQLFIALETKEPDLILLDITSSESHDFELCRHVRDVSLVPIIVMSAPKQEHDKARALDSGADDYLTKPFSAVELLAQVRAILRRSQWNTNEHLRNLRPTLTFGNLVVDFLQHRVTIDGRHVALTPIEYRLFSYLAQNAGRIVTHNLLLEAVWGREYLGETNLLKVHINRLRHKIEPDPARPMYIITRTGLGYLFPSQPATSLPRMGESSHKASGGDRRSLRVGLG